MLVNNCEILKYSSGEQYKRVRDFRRGYFRCIEGEAVH